MAAGGLASEGFWLPSDFQADDFLHREEEEEPAAAADDNRESDEEEFVAGLSRRLARSSLAHQHKNQQQMLATSPQSTLSGLGSWSSSSNNGSPDGPSQVSSPPSSPSGRERDDALDLLYAAAGQVVHLRLNEQQRGILPHPTKPDPRLLLDATLVRQHLQAAQFYRMKREQLVRQQVALACQRRNIARPGGGFGPSSSAWPTRIQQLQRQQLLPGSGTRAVFLNGSGTRRESAGTGVFLPRAAGTTPNEPTRKPACSSVLLPERVVQALNLDLDETGVNQRATGARFGPGCYGTTKEMVQQQQQSRNNNGAFLPRSRGSSGGPEIRLPQEWTY